jgi:hypothetical protein
MLIDMIFKLYKSRVSSGKKPEDKEVEWDFKGFQEIYSKYGVKVIGAWENMDDPQEGYLITAYRDNTHYEETVVKMRADPKYMELTKKRQENFETFEVATMKLIPGSPET